MRDGASRPKTQDDDDLATTTIAAGIQKTATMAPSLMAVLASRPSRHTKRREMAIRRRSSEWEETAAMVKTKYNAVAPWWHTLRWRTSAKWVCVCERRV